MKNILILLLFCSTLHGQVTVIDNEIGASDTIYVDDPTAIGVYVAGGVYQENSLQSLISFWSDTLNYTTNKWIDKSGNGNDLDLVQLMNLHSG